MSVAQRHDRVQPPSAGEPSPALAAIVDFGRRFGRAHVALAMHAAVPLGLTPELLHVIRFNCVRGVPRIAEADLLLSPLCRDMGRGFYQMPRDVRDLLIDELRRDAELGDPAVKRVAGLLLAYAEQSMATARDVETRAFLRAQQWAGLAVLRPASAARALAAAIRDGLAEGSRADVLRAANVAQALAGPLCGEERVLLYATGLQRLYAGKHSQAAASFQDAEAADRPAAIGDVALPSLRQLTQAMVHRAAAPSGETQTPVRVLYENVQVTVYVPRTVRPEEWYSLPVFTHLDEKPSGAGDDVPPPRGGQEGGPSDPRASDGRIPAHSPRPPTSRAARR